MNAPSLARVIPALGWLRTYDRSWLRSNVFAGITLAAYLLPAGLGDASLANLPPEAGLYACLFGGLVFWLFVVRDTQLPLSPPKSRCSPARRLDEETEEYILRLDVDQPNEFRLMQNG
jgi:sulfate permease family protein